VRIARPGITLRPFLPAASYEADRAMLRFFTRLLNEEDGPTAVEYAVLLALILVSIISVIGALGSQTGGMWGKNQDELINAGLGK
jgi:pilus assembly protein Flp/PilA